MNSTPETLQAAAADAEAGPTLFGDPRGLATLPALYLRLFWWTAIGGAIMPLVTSPVKRLMAGVR